MCDFKRIIHKRSLGTRNVTDQFHKSQNATVPYPTTLHSEQKCAHFCSEWSIVGVGTGTFWDLLIRSIARMWMPENLTDEKSTLVQVMDLCRQAASHYKSQCWHRWMSPYGVTGPHWVNTLRPRQNGRHFPDDIFKCVFLNEIVCISLKVFLRFQLTICQYWFR